MHLHDVDSAICLDSSFGPVYLYNHVINSTPSGVRRKKKEEKKEKVYEGTYSSNNEPSKAFLLFLKIHVKKTTFLLPLYNRLQFYR